MKTTKHRSPLKQKSHLSQVFLKTEEPCQRLADLLKAEDIQHTLEIGPGKGILTKVLLEKGLHVLSVEKDHRFFHYIKKNFCKDIESKNLDIENEDILKFDLKSWLAQNSEKSAICGNIPYNISTPILERVLPLLKDLRLVVLLVQLEFAERLVSEPGKKSYGSLSVFTQLRCTPKLVAIVPKTDFDPVPKVDSAIVALYPKMDVEDEETLRKVEILTKSAFSQRRKKLSNALSKYLEKEADLGIDLSQRPDALSPTEYLKLAKKIL